MTSGIMNLRRYQEDSIWATFSSYTRPLDRTDYPDIPPRRRRPAVVLPTGAGKTVIFSWMTKMWLDGTWRESGPGRLGQVVILVHRDELVNQTVAKLAAVAPEIKTGVVKGARNDLLAPVIVASVQTLTKPARLSQLVGRVSLVIVDECHHATAASYVRIMEELGCFRPADDPTGAKAVGFTATMTRADAGALGDVWEEVVYSKDILDMIAMGYLSDAKGYLVTVDGMSLDEVKRSRGDYQAASLSEILKTSGAITATVDAWVEQAKDRPTILFAPTVETAELFTTAFQERGIRAATVHGAMPEDERRNVLRRFDAGKLDVINNCMVLTEGFDSPRASCVVVARPTTSAGLYVQMVGRGLRPYPGKEFCLVLDVVGASGQHRLATIADLTSQRVPDIAQGESLAEAAERAMREGALDLSGDVAVAEVDLFGRSETLWLQTKEGCWFIPATNDAGQDWYVFLWPSGGLWNVSRCQHTAKGSQTLHKGLELTDAMAWGEQEAASLGARYASRTASWRAGRTLATTGQLGFLKSLGLWKEGQPEPLKKDAGDMISVALASRRLDKGYRVIKEREGL